MARFIIALFLLLAPSAGECRRVRIDREPGRLRRSQRSGDL